MEVEAGALVQLEAGALVQVEACATLKVEAGSPVKVEAGAAVGEVAAGEKRKLAVRCSSPSKTCPCVRARWELKAAQVFLPSAYPHEACFSCPPEPWLSYSGVASFYLSPFSFSPRSSYLNFSFARTYYRSWILFSCPKS